MTVCFGIVNVLFLFSSIFEIALPLELFCASLILIFDITLSAIPFGFNICNSVSSY